MRLEAWKPIGDDTTGSLLHGDAVLALLNMPDPQAPRVDLAFTHAVVPRVPGGCSYYHTSVQPWAMRYHLRYTLCTWDPFETVI